MADLIKRIQPIMMAFKNNLGNQSKILLDIEKYWEQDIHNCFYNIDKTLGFDKFFDYLGIIVKPYKRIQIFVAF